MKITTVKQEGVEIAIVNSEEPIIIDGQSALDLIGTVGFEAGCEVMVLKKESISEDFFNLKTNLAGEVLQKFINYHMKIAIVGDFSVYQSKSLKDFMYESNKGKTMFFVSTEKEAVEKLCN